MSFVRRIFKILYSIIAFQSIYVSFGFEIDVVVGGADAGKRSEAFFYASFVDGACDPLGKILITKCIVLLHLTSYSIATIKHESGFKSRE